MTPPAPALPLDRAHDELAGAGDDAAAHVVDGVDVAPRLHRRLRGRFDHVQVDPVREHLATADDEHPRVLARRMLDRPGEAPALPGGHRAVVEVEPQHADVAGAAVADVADQPRPDGGDTGRASVPRAMAAGSLMPAPAGAARRTWPIHTAPSPVRTSTAPWRRRATVPGSPAVAAGPAWAWASNTDTSAGRTSSVRTPGAPSAARIRRTMCSVLSCQENSRSAWRICGRSRPITSGGALVQRLGHERRIGGLGHDLADQLDRGVGHRPAVELALARAHRSRRRTSASPRPARRPSPRRPGGR